MAAPNFLWFLGAQGANENQIIQNFSVLKSLWTNQDYYGTQGNHLPPPGTQIKSQPVTPFFFPSGSLEAEKSKGVQSL